MRRRDSRFWLYVAIFWSFFVLGASLVLTYQGYISRMRHHVTQTEAEERYQKAVRKHQLMDEIMRCESNCKHTGLWDEHHASGILQYKKSTFYELAEKAGMKKADWKSKGDQIALLSWSLDHGYGPKWACYRKIKRQEDSNGRLREGN